MSSVPQQPVLRPARRQATALSALFPPSSFPASPFPESRFPQARNRGGPDPAVSGVTLDSRLVEPGDLYVALPGRHRHGMEFAAAAVGAGATALLTDPSGGQSTQAARVASRAPVVVVPDPRRVMAEVAARVYGDPAAALTMCAVTGTNGKTTTSYLLEAVLIAAGWHPGLVGTLGFRFDGRPLPGARTTITTPESPELHALLAYLREQGADSVAMEVSSHALVLGRVDGITFDVAAFTNLGRDHLDFHGDEESYFAAKASLFAPDRTRHAVVSVDDPRGRQLAARIAAEGRPRLTTVSLDGPADCRLLAAAPAAAGRIAVRAEVREQVVPFELALPGDYNLRNALTALAMADAVGVDLQQAARGLATAVVPGRLQRVPLPGPPEAPQVYVDFAHTPQAVSAALAAVRGVRGSSTPHPMGATNARCLVVLGCGGDRDPSKRRPMGAAAARGADVVIVTDDNPRSEEPDQIRAQVLTGAEAAQRAERLSVSVLDGGDRRSAIRRALELARPDDVVAVLGKGHEDGQEIRGEVRPFSDADVIGEEWQRMRGQTHPASKQTTR